MRILLSEPRIDAIVSHGRRIILVGTAPFGMAVVFQVFHLAWPEGWRFGLTGFMVLSLGIYALALRRWRTDPGLWMLAVFLTLSLGTCFGYFEWLAWQSLLEPLAPNLAARPRTWAEIGYGLDCSLALVVFGRIVRFTASVAVANWQTPFRLPLRSAQPEQWAEGRSRCGEF